MFMNNHDIAIISHKATYFIRWWKVFNMQKIPADLCLDQSWNEMAVLFVCDVRENEPTVREIPYKFN